MIDDASHRCRPIPALLVPTCQTHKLPARLHLNPSTKAMSMFAAGAPDVRSRLDTSSCRITGVVVIVLPPSNARFRVPGRDSLRGPVVLWLVHLYPFVRIRSDLTSFPTARRHRPKAT